MFEDLKIILYPDPRLRKVSAPVKTFDANLAALAERMLELMREFKGVGLAAPQVGLNIRLFVINPTAQPGEDRVYVNPVLSDAEGELEGEEGCLSIPNLHVNIWRSKNVRMRAQDLTGQPFEQIESGFIPRIWQHELDHLDGKLILDRMGPTAKLLNRKTIKEMEAKWEAEHPKSPPKSPKRTKRA